MNGSTARLLRKVATLESVVSGQTVHARVLKHVWGRLNARGRRTMRVAARREVQALNVELLTGLQRENALADRRETAADTAAREALVEQVRLQQGIGARILMTLAMVGARLGFGGKAAR